MKNIKVFYLKIFSFLVVKFSIYLNRRVFVMVLQFNESPWLEPYISFNSKKRAESKSEFEKKKQKKKKLNNSVYGKTLAT